MVSPASSRPASRRIAWAGWLRPIVNSAVTAASLAPARTSPASARRPSAKPSASKRIDLPAPVSPVSTHRPGRNASESRSISTTSRMVSPSSIAAMIQAPPRPNQRPRSSVLLFLQGICRRCTSRTLAPVRQPRNNGPLCDATLAILGQGPVMTASKPELYRDLASELAALLAGEPDRIANAANMSGLIYHRLPDLNWAGFYFRQGAELVLGPVPGQARLCAHPYRPGCVRYRRGARRNGAGPGRPRFPRSHRLRRGFALRARRAVGRGRRGARRARPRQPVARAFRRGGPGRMRAARRIVRRSPREVTGPRLLPSRPPQAGTHISHGHRPSPVWRKQGPLYWRGVEPMQSAPPAAAVSPHLAVRQDW